MTRFSPTCLRNGLLALMIASALLLAATPTRAQDERPDLEIKVAGLNGGSQRNVKITVDNISNWWSDKTLATVQTVPPNDKDPMLQEVPDLGEKGTKDQSTPSHFEFIYPLPENCDGHKVRASLSAGANYEGVKEGSSAMVNNVHELLICNPKTAQSGNPQPKPADCDPRVYLVCPDGEVPKIDKIEIARTLGEQWTSPGPHSRTVDASVLKGNVVERRDPGLLGGCQGHYQGLKLAVGQDSTNAATCDRTTIFQVFAWFDLDWLRHVEKKIISRAELKVELGPIESYAFREECIGQVSVAPSNAQAVLDSTSLFVGEDIGSRLASSGAIQSWNVSNQIQSAANPANPDLTGFVLRGYSENLEEESEVKCVAPIEKVQLVVDWTTIS